MMVALDIDADAGPERKRLAPVESPRSYTRPAQDRVVAQAGDDDRPVALPQPLQRRQVHMVVMIVADEDEVDLGQILEADARRPHPLWADEGEGRSTLRPDRIGENVEPASLDEHGRVADPGDSHQIGIDAVNAAAPILDDRALEPRTEGGLGGRIAGLDRHLARPLGASAREKARQEASWAAAIRRKPRIEEALAVEMVAARAFIIDAVEEWRHERRREAERDQGEQDYRADALEQGSHGLAS